MHHKIEVSTRPMKTDKLETEKVVEKNNVRRQLWDSLLEVYEKVKGVKSSASGIKLTLPTHSQCKLEKPVERNHANLKSVLRSINKKTKLANKTLLSSNQIHEMERICKQSKAGDIKNPKANKTKYKVVNNSSFRNANYDVYPVIVLHPRKKKNLETSSYILVTHYKQSHSSFKLSYENLMHHKLSKLSKKHLDKGDKQNKKHGKLATQNNHLPAVTNKLNCANHEILENNNLCKISKKSKDRLKKKRDRVLVYKASAAQLESNMKNKRQILDHRIQMSKLLDKPNDLLNTTDFKKIKDYEKGAVFVNPSQEYKIQKYSNDPVRLKSSLNKTVPKTIQTKKYILRAEQNNKYVGIKQPSILYPDKQTSLKKLISTKKVKKHRRKQQVNPVLTDFSLHAEYKNKAAEQRKERKSGHYADESIKNINNQGVSARKTMKALETLNKDYYKDDFVKELSKSVQNTIFEEGKFMAKKPKKLSIIFSETITSKPNDNGIPTIESSNTFITETENLIKSHAGQNKDEESTCSKLEPKKHINKECYSNRILPNPSHSEDKKKATFQIIKDNVTPKETTRSKKKQHNDKKITRNTAQDKKNNRRRKLCLKICEDDCNSTLQKNQLTLFYANRKSPKVSKESLKIAISRDTPVCENGSSNNLLNVVIKNIQNSVPNTTTHLPVMSEVEKISSDKYFDLTKKEGLNLENAQDLQEFVDTNDNCLEKNTRKKEDCQTDDLTKYKTPRLCRKTITLNNVHNQISMPNHKQLKNTMEGEQSRMFSDMFDESRTSPNKKEKEVIKSTEELRTQVHESTELCKKHTVNDLFLGFLNNVDTPHILNVKNDIKKEPLSKILGENYICAFYEIINNEISKCPIKENIESNEKESIPVVKYKTANLKINNHKDRHEIRKGTSFSLLKTSLDIRNTERLCLELKLQQLGLQEKTQFVRRIDSKSDIDTKKYKINPTRKTRLNGHGNASTKDENDVLKGVDIKIENNHTRNSENHEYQSKLKISHNLTSTKQSNSKTKLNTDKSSFGIGCNEVSDLGKDSYESNNNDLSNSTKSHRGNEESIINRAHIQDAENCLKKQNVKLVVLDPVKDKTYVENENTTKNDFFIKNKINYRNTCGPDHKSEKNFLAVEVGVQTDFIEPFLKAGKKTSNCGTLISKDAALLAKEGGKTNDRHLTNINESLFCDDGDKTKPLYTRKSFFHTVNYESKINKETLCTVIKPIDTEFTNVNLENSNLSEFIEIENQIVYKINAIYEFLQHMDKMLKENTLLRCGKGYESINTIGQFNNTLRCLCSNCLEVIHKIKSNPSREKCKNVIPNSTIPEKVLFQSTYNVVTDKKGHQFSNLIETDSSKDKEKQLGNEKSQIKSYQTMPPNIAKISHFVNRFDADSSKQISRLYYSNCNVPMALSCCNYPNCSMKNQLMNQIEDDLKLTKNIFKFPKLNNSGVNVSPNNTKNGVFFNRLEVDTLRKDQFNQGYNANIRNPFVKIVSENGTLKKDSSVQIDPEEILTPHTEKRQHFVKRVGEDSGRSMENFQGIFKHLNENSIKKSVEVDSDIRPNNMYFQAEREPFFVIVPSNKTLNEKVKYQSESHQKKHNFDKSEPDDLMSSSKINAKEDYFDTLLMKRKIENCDTQAVWWKEKSDSQNDNLFKLPNNIDCCGKRKSLKNVLVNTWAEENHTSNHGDSNNFKVHNNIVTDEGLYTTVQHPSLNKQGTCLFSEPFYELSRENMSSYNSLQLASPLGLLSQECDGEILTNSFLASDLDPRELPDCCLCLNDEKNSVSELQNLTLSNEQNVERYKHDLSRQWKYRNINHNDKKNEFFETSNDNIAQIGSCINKIPPKTNILNNMWNKCRDSKLCLQDSHYRNSNIFHANGNLECESNVNFSLLTYVTEDSKHSVHNSSSLLEELKQTNMSTCLPCESEINCFKSGSKSSIVSDHHNELLNRNSTFPSGNWHIVNETSDKESQNSQHRKLSKLNLSKKSDNTKHIKSYDCQVIYNIQNNNIKHIENIEGVSRQKLPFTMRELMSENSLSRVSLNRSKSFLEQCIPCELGIESKNNDNDLDSIFTKNNTTEANKFSKSNDNGLDNVLSKGSLTVANNESKGNGSDVCIKLVQSESDLSEANSMFLVSNETSLDKSVFDGWTSLSKCEMQNTELEYTKVADWKTRK